YIIVLALIIGTTVHPLLIDSSEAIMDIHEKSGSNKSDTNFKWNKTLIASMMLLLIIIVFILKIIMQLIRDKIPLSDFLIIRPSLEKISIQEWFFQGKNAVPIYLTVFVLLLLVVVFALFLPELAKKRGIRSVVPLLPSELEGRLQTEGKSLAGFQSILVFGGYITFFLYLLITVLYSALSSVPNPSSLSTYPEESIIWIIVLLFFICCLLGTGMFYWWNDDFKTNKIDIKESDMG
ncbi:MAG: hypothetical protein ACTSSO_02565, partial [Candidatus Hodarchaeales archaeon]